MPAAAPHFLAPRLGEATSPEWSGDRSGHTTDVGPVQAALGGERRVIITILKAAKGTLSDKKCCVILLGILQRGSASGWELAVFIEAARNAIASSISLAYRCLLPASLSNRSL